MSSSSTNRLVPIDQSNWRDALRVRVGDEPLAYVSPDGTMIAVLALTHVGTIVEVRNLAVDITRQGTGVGTELMGAVLDWCRAPGSPTSVELTFHPTNEAAARLYGRAGFTPTGTTPATVSRSGDSRWMARRSSTGTERLGSAFGATRIPELWVGSGRSMCRAARVRRLREHEAETDGQVVAVAEFGSFEGQPVPASGAP